MTALKAAVSETTDGTTASSYLPSSLRGSENEEDFLTRNNNHFISRRKVFNRLKD